MDIRILDRTHRKILRSLTLTFAIAALCAHASVYSQTNPGVPLSHYNIRSWSTNDGLPNDKIQDVHQSVDGYIWLASQEGLVRFDGARFDIYDKKNTPVFPHSQVTSLAETGDSTLWLTTIRGILRYRNGNFESVPADSDGGNFIGNAVIVQRSGKILVGARDALYRLDNGVLRRVNIPGNPRLLSVNTICEDGDEELWLGTSSGAKLFDHGRLINVAGNGIPHNAFVTRFLRATNGTLWVGTQEGLYTAPAGRPRKFTRMAAIGAQGIHSLLEDRAGNIWIGTEQQGLLRMSGGKLESLTTKNGLSANYIISLCEDREGNIWAGTFYNGVDEIWRGKFETYSTDEGLAGPLVRSIVEDSHHTIWIGTESGLSKLEHGKMVSYTTKDGLPHNQIRSIYVDARGIVWLGTRDGVSRFDGKHFFNYTTKSGLVDGYSRVVTEDFDGNILIGHNVLGIDRLREGKITNMVADGIPPIGIRLIYRGRNKTLWIGTLNGLIRWRDRKATFYRSEAGVPGDIFSLHEDVDGTLWIGTYGDGLFRFKDEKATQISTRDGLFDDVVYQILEDDQHNFWMSSNKGIYCVGRKDLNDVADRKITKISCISYGTADGMRSSECNGNSQPAGFRTSDGQLWFPTTNGVAVIDPAHIYSNTVPPQVTIEALKVDSLSVGLDRPVSIGPGYSYLEIRYAGLSFVIPDRMIFQFKLDGFDKDWRNAGTRRAAYYTNVPPGNYIFRVRARNNDNVWNEQGTELPIELKPYFYQTSYFFALCVILIATAGFVLYRWRVAMLLQQERILKQRVDESLAQIKVLGGLIPICANCKKIRDDRGYWNQLEKYLKDHSEAEFTHGICPECKEKLYGPYMKKKSADVDNKGDN